MIGPGKIITHYLGMRNIKPHDGCSCYPLAQEMDKAGPDEIMNNFDEWVDKMIESQKQWRKSSNRVWEKFVIPPRFLTERLIRKACKESKESINGQNNSNCR